MTQTNSGNAAEIGVETGPTTLHLTHQELRKRVSDSNKPLIAQLSKPKALRSIGLYAVVYLAIAGLIGAGIYIDTWWFTALVVVLIAGRQHSLYIINHDASHYALFEDKSLNQSVATVLSNLVMFHHPEAWSFVQWRRVHMLHHKYLFTELDPNYVGRKNKGDTLASPSLAKLAYKVVSGGLLNIRDLIVGRQDHVSDKGGEISSGKYTHLLGLFKPYQDDAEMEIERRLKLGFFAVALLLITALGVWSEFLVYWILPMYTIYPMILRFHDLTEHRWEKPTEALQINTRTRHDGWLFKLFFSALPRGYHSEHHIYPRVGVVDLALVNQLLVKDHLLSPPAGGVSVLFGELAGKIVTPDHNANPAAEL